MKHPPPPPHHHHAPSNVIHAANDHVVRARCTRLARMVKNASTMTVSKIDEGPSMISTETLLIDLQWGPVACLSHCKRP